jgi:4-hydroxybenzoate polyprenyltransferase
MPVNALTLALSLRLHVAAMPAVVTLFFADVLGFNVDARYYLIVTLNTLAGYWANMLTDTTEDNANGRASSVFVSRYPRAFRLLILMTFIAALALSISSGWRFVIYGFALNFLGFLYSQPMSLASGGKSLRIKNRLILKNVYPAFFWSASLLVGPFVYTHRALPVDRLYAVAAVFCWAAYVELMWDVRDARGDRLAGVDSIPLRWGEVTTERILHALNLSAAVIITVAFVVGVAKAPWMTAIVVGVATAVFTRIYFRAPEKEWHSHAFLFMVGAILLIAALAPLYLTGGSHES